MYKSQEWDQTNFLVDLAGHYANCEQLGRTGPIRVDRVTPQGESITGFVENIDGSATDVDAVNGYLRSLIDDWTRSRRYNGMVSSCHCSSFTTARSTSFSSSADGLRL